jgi:rsbT co-antagonist protein RsbR
MTQRNITLAALGLFTVGTILFAISSFATQGATLISIVAAVIGVLYVLLFASYWRGWEPARYVLIAISTITFSAVEEPYLTQQFSPGIFIPTVIAAIMGGPYWIAGAAVFTIVIILGKAKLVGVYADPITLILYSMTVGGIILARLLTDRAIKQAEQSAAKAEEARLHAEEQAKALAEANQLAQGQLSEQQRLLDLVATLEIPATQLADGVLFAPLVGHLDTRRAQEFTTRLLEDAHSQRARHIVIDIAGVAMVDTAVARALISMVQALRLLGCEVTISGISSDVAITLTHLGVDLNGITTVRNPQEALARLIHRGAVMAN